MDDDYGQLLAGRYQLTHLLGQGGMGAVWRAHDTQLARDVAVKELRLPGHLGDAERANWIARIDREARAAARLKHPGIVTVHDRIAGTDGRPWIVMELVTGGSLADLIEARGPLPPHEVANIGLQVAAALSAAHRMGITHRDIKPANILLEEGRAVLTDFGIAALEGDATLTATGMIMGTPAFMAPEQIRGLPATAESDLWSLGATLYASVEGRAPFAATTPSAVLVAVATEDPAPAVQAGSLAPVLEGLLRKNPAERLTMDQLQARLAQPVTVWAPAPGTPDTPDTPAPQSAPSAPPPSSPAPMAQPPTVTAMAPPPVGGPAMPVAAPVVPPHGPSAPRRRWSTRRTVLSVIAALAVAAAAVTGYVLMNSDAFNSTYQENLRAAEGYGIPDDYRRESQARVSEDRARVTYTAECDGDKVDACGDPVNSAQLWLTKLPGTAGVDFTQSSACLSSEQGCPIQVTPTNNQDVPIIRRAVLRQHREQGNHQSPLSSRYLLEVDFGR
ncbi:serine/threonine-protein kinase [Streptomyces sp. NPDC007325]|uniref:serine/threonine-protein kinase n=1 Tax=Streptomyces sp. NPDC007325 TaxID=3154588 RepID=UPI0033C2D9CB